MKGKRAAGIENKLAFVTLVSLVALLLITSGCVAVGAQTKEPSTYSSEIYDAPLRLRQQLSRRFWISWLKTPQIKMYGERRSMSVDISPLMSGGMLICKDWRPAWSG